MSKTPFMIKGQIIPKDPKIRIDIWHKAGVFFTGIRTDGRNQSLATVVPTMSKAYGGRAHHHGHEGNQTKADTTGGI